MTDPVFALIAIVVFLAVMAAAHFFKTLDADLWHAWRTPVAAGLAAGALLWLLGPHPIATGLVLSAAALYVRLMGRESEAVDGMLLGGCSGAAAALPLIFRGGNELLTLAECIAAGAVAGYGITFAAVHVRARGRQIAIDVVTALAAVGAAYAPRAIVAAGASPRAVALAVAALLPLVVVAAVFQQWPDIRSELRHEASLGFLDDADVRRTAHPILRLGGGGWTDRHAHRELVRLANEIALRKRRQRDRPDDVARLYQLEIIKLRMQIQEMSRIDRAMRSGDGGEEPSDTMAHSK
jgi:hypothetical protein